jgi:cobalt/nickel transport system permease protein
LADSLLRRTDARWKLLLCVAAAIVIASEPRGELRPFLGYWPLIGGLALAGRVPLGSWARRCAAALPFLALSAVLPFAVDAPGLAPGDWAASIFLRGAAAVALLALLAETTEFAELIGALQRFRLPGVWVTALALAFRYVFLLADEWRRTNQARACRAPGLAGMALARVTADQLGLVFVRAWERGERVHGAMLARGFDGSWPVSEVPKNAATGALGCLLVLALFVWLRTAV